LRTTTPLSFYLPSEADLPRECSLRLPLLFARGLLLGAGLFVLALRCRNGLVPIFGLPLYSQRRNALRGKGRLRPGDLGHLYCQLGGSVRIGRKLLHLLQDGLTIGFQRLNTLGKLRLSTLGVVNLLDTHPLWQSCSMNTAAPANRYKNHRFPVEIISHAVWLYFRFCLSCRDVEEILLERGVGVTYEAIRKWCRKVGQPYATQLRRRRPRPGDKGHLDEVFLTLKGERP
jgi:hypothetical protein